ARGEDGPQRGRDTHVRVCERSSTTLAEPRAPARVSERWSLPPARSAAARVCTDSAALPGDRRPRPRTQRFDEARVSGTGLWGAAPYGTPCRHRFTGVRRACAWPPYPPRYSVGSSPGWYGRRVPARPADSHRPGRRGAPPG